MALCLAVCMATAQAAGDDRPAFRAVLRSGGSTEGRLAPTADEVAFLLPTGLPIRLAEIERIESLGRAAAFPARSPLRRLRLAGGDLVTCELPALDAREASLRLFDAAAIVVPRSGLAAIAALPREREVFYSDFLDRSPAWTSPDGTAPRILPRDAGGGIAVSDRWELTTSFDEPLDGGRVAISMRVESPAPDNILSGRLEVDLRFDELPTDDAATRRVRLSIDATGIRISGLPGREDLESVRELRLSLGRRQATLRFDRSTTRVLLDGEVIASARRGPGRLRGIRLSSTGAEPASNGARIVIESVQAQRLAETGPAAIRKSRSTGPDCLALADGTEFFGRVEASEGGSVDFTVAGRRIGFPWGDVREASFARPARSTAGAEIAGSIARIELFSPADHFPWPVDSPADALTGALVNATRESLVLRHPWLGELALPIAAIRRIEPRYEGSLLLLDADAHRLTERIDPAGGAEDEPLSGFFPLERVPAGRVFLTVNALDVYPCGPETPPGSPFLAELRAGFWRTELIVNGVRVGDVNSHLTYQRSPTGSQRVRVRIPNERLKEGANAWSLERRPDRAGKRYNPCELGPVWLEIHHESLTAEPGR